jgi:hypothetical protein
MIDWPAKHEHASDQHLMLPLRSHHLPSSESCAPKHLTGPHRSVEGWSRHFQYPHSCLAPYFCMCVIQLRGELQVAGQRRSRSLLKPLTNKNMNHGIFRKLNWNDYSGGGAGAGRLASVGYTSWVSPVWNLPLPSFPRLEEAGSRFLDLHSLTGLLFRTCLAGHIRCLLKGVM